MTEKLPAAPIAAKNEAAAKPAPAPATHVAAAHSAEKPEPHAEAPSRPTTSVGAGAHVADALHKPGRHEHIAQSAGPTPKG